MSERLRALALGPRTSEPIDLVPWLREVRRELDRSTPGAAAEASAQALAGLLSEAPRGEALAGVLRSHAVALYETIGSLCRVREAMIERGVTDGALVKCERLIGALALAYEDLRTGSSANRRTVEQALARL